MLNESNTFKSLKNYYEILQNTNPSEEDKNFIYFYELDLAASLLKDFEPGFCELLAKILLTYSSK